MNLDKVTAVIVLYDASNIVLDCIKNLENTKLIIVDNGRNDPELIDEIKKSKNLFKYIKTEKNLGFGKACNLAYKQVLTE
jgi:Predicted glycosyltransferases